MKRRIYVVLYLGILFLLACDRNSGIICKRQNQLWQLGNRMVEISYNGQNGRISVFRADHADHPFLTLSIKDASGPASFGQLDMPGLKDNRCLTVETRDSRLFHFALMPNNSFVFMRPVIEHGSLSKPLKRIWYPRLSLSATADSLQAFGTFGIAPIGDNPGSYTFMALVQPQNNSGMVSGWLSQERGSGLIFSDLHNGQIELRPCLDYGHFAPAEPTPLECFVFAYFNDARLGLERYADLVARYLDIQLPSQPAYYCTWHHARASNEVRVVKNAEFVADNLKPCGLEVIQIDDRWQDGLLNNGPGKVFTRHRADGPYPSGMAKTAAAIRRLGLIPGIWYMPFTGNSDDPFFADKGYLFARQQGEPFRTRWGGDCFDLSHPKTLEYVEEVAHRLTREWGYGYLKMDGLWTGLVARHVYINRGYKTDGFGKIKLHNPQITAVEAYRNGLRTIRKAVGKRVFLSGCNAAQNMRTLGASFGLLDAMRVGADNGPTWQRFLRGVFSGSNLYFLHNRIWYNDPDPVHVRSEVPIQQARALVSWTAVSGQIHGSSESYANLSPQRLDLLKKSLPPHQAVARPLDLFRRQRPALWLVSDSTAGPPRYVVGLFNWQEKDSLDLSIDLNDLGSLCWVYDFWQHRFLGPMSDSLCVLLPPTSCRILALRKVMPHPLIVSTSGHITQGIADLKNETWSATQNALYAGVELGAEKPYEIRIALPAFAAPWRVKAIKITPAFADVSVFYRIQENLLTVELASAVARDLTCRIGFNSDP